MLQNRTHLAELCILLFSSRVASGSGILDFHWIEISGLNFLSVYKIWCKNLIIGRNRAYGPVCTVFSLWSATSATPAKQEWHASPNFRSRTVRAAACKILCRGASVVAGKPARTALQWSRRDSTKVVTSLAVTSRPSWRRTENSPVIYTMR